LIIYAACGLVLSLAVHVLSFFGIAVGGNLLFMGLHIAIFPLWIPVVFMMQRLTRGMPSRKGTWDFMLSGCPVWMKYMVRGFYVYAIVNFVIFVFLVSPAGKQIGGAPPASVVHGFSGHWMLFYSGALAALITIYRREITNFDPKCSSGHRVGYDDKFCPACGEAVRRDMPGKNLARF
jgi:hypothetical protein